MFDVILADPPWLYKCRTERATAESVPYQTMTVDELCALNVGALAAENCALFLWCTWPTMLNEGTAERVIKAWGFKYSSLAWEWIKTSKTGQKFHWGRGYGTRANPEPCILCLKGSMPVAVHDELSLIFAPIREHSRKPDEQYTKIERLYPDRRYLELFARRRRLGWSAWGNQVESDVVIPTKQKGE